MKKKYKVIFGVLLGVVAAAYALYALLMPVEALFEPLAAAPLGDSFTAQGTLEPAESLIINANTNGTVLSPVQAGRRVKQGEPLVTVDSAALSKELKQQIDTLKLQKAEMTSESSIRREQLKVQLETAEIDYYRQYGREIGSAAATADLAFSSYLLARNNFYDAEEANEGFAPGISGVNPPVSSRELYALEQQMVSARKNYIITRNATDDTNQAYSTALVDSYKAQLGLIGNYSAQQLQVTIDYLESKLNPQPIAAPYDGLVWESYVEAGGYVSENTPVARIFQEGDMKITVELLSEDATGLSPGDQVECALTDGSSFTAKVAFISPVATQSLSGIGLSENRRIVELSPIDLPPQAGAGFQVDLTFRSSSFFSVLSVPSSAILPLAAGSGVYLVQGGKAVLTPVETGLRAGGRVELLSGVTDGDIVITNPQDIGVKSGKRVKQL